MKKYSFSVMIIIILGLLFVGCGKDEPTQSTTIITAKCVDEENNPVADAVVQFCDDSSCNTVKSDESGIASFEGTSLVFTVHAIKAPEGYTIITTEEQTVSSTGSTELTFVFAKEISDSASVDEEFEEYEEANEEENEKEYEEEYEDPYDLILEYEDPRSDSVWSQLSFERETTDTSDKVVPGSKPLKFTTVDIDGNPVDESILKKADVTALAFFETWCGWCIADMNNLSKLNEVYSKYGFQVIGVYNLGKCRNVSPSNMDELKQFREEKNPSYLWIENTPDIDWNELNARPAIIFVDSEGRPLRITDPAVYEEICRLNAEGYGELYYFLYSEWLKNDKIREMIPDDMLPTIEEYIEKYETDPEEVLPEYYQIFDDFEDFKIQNGITLRWQSTEALNYMTRYFLGMKNDK